MTNETGLFSLPSFSWLNLNNLIAYLIGVVSGISANWIYRQLELRSKRSHMRVERDEEVVTFQGCWTSEDDQRKDIKTLDSVRFTQRKKIAKVLRPSENEQSTEDEKLYYHY